MRLDETFIAQRRRGSEEMGSTVMALPSLHSLRRRNLQMQDGEETAPHSHGIEKRQFKIRLANMPTIRSEASMLIKERYVQRGYGVQELHENPNRMTIVAYDGTEAIGTLSIGFDSEAGLLSDALYKPEIDALRGQGRRVCEFIKFAIHPSSVSINVVAALFHVAFIHAHRIYRFDDVVMEITPQHFRFYKRALGFRQIGAARVNERVNTTGVLSHCRFSYIGAQLKRFGGNIKARKEEKSIYPYGFSAEEEHEIIDRISSLSRQQ